MKDGVQVLWQALFLGFLVCGIVQGVESPELGHSSMIKRLPKVVYTGPGLQIKYHRRNLPEKPRKILVWTADDAEWLRRTFEREQSISVIQTATASAVNYIRDVFVDRVSTSLLFVFRGIPERVGITIRFPSEKEMEQAHKKGDQAPVVITVYGHWPFVPVYFIEFFKTMASKPAKSSFLVRCAQRLFLIGAVWFGLQKIKKRAGHGSRAKPSNQREVPLNVTLGAAVCDVASEQIFKPVSMVDAACDTQVVSMADAMCGTEPVFATDVACEVRLPIERRAERVDAQMQFPDWVTLDFKEPVYNLQSCTARAIAQKLQKTLVGQRYLVKVCGEIVEATLNNSPPQHVASFDYQYGHCVHVYIAKINVYDSMDSWKKAQPLGWRLCIPVIDIIVPEAGSAEMPKLLRRSVSAEFGQGPIQQQLWNAITDKMIEEAYWQAIAELA